MLRLQRTGPVTEPQLLTHRKGEAGTGPGALPGLRWVGERLERSPWLPGTLISSESSNKLGRREHALAETTLTGRPHAQEPKREWPGLSETAAGLCLPTSHLQVTRLAACWCLSVHN